MLRIVLDKDRTLDMYPDTEVPISKRILDIEEYAARTDSFSEEFDIPMTPENNRIFEEIFCFDRVTGTFDPRRRTQATLLDGANVLFTGALKLNRANIAVGQQSYTIEFIGSVTNLINALDGLNLRQLDLSKWNHIKTIQTVEDSWSNTSGYVYPSIVYSDTEPEAGGPLNQFKLNRIFPAAYIHTIWDAVFAAAGYTWESNFLSTSDWFRTIVTPFTKQTISQTDLEDVEGAIEEAEQTTTRVGMHSATIRHRSPSYIDNTWKYYDATFEAFTYVSSPSPPIFTQTTGSTLQWEWTDPSNTMGGNDFWTCPADGTYDIDILINFGLWIRRNPGTNRFRYKDGTFRYRWWVYLQPASGSTIQMLSRNAPITSDNPYHISSMTPNSVNDWVDVDSINDSVRAVPIKYQGTLDLKAGDVIYVKYGFKNELDFRVGGLQGSKNRMAAAPLWVRTVGTEVSRWNITQAVDESNDWSTKYPVNFAKTLPDMLASDWLVDIIKMFTLVIEPDPDNPTHLRIEPYEDFFANTREVDWTDKIDQENIQELEFTTDVKKYLMKWDKDSDWLATRYDEDTGGEVFGNYEFVTQNEWSQESDEVQLKHASTLNLSDPERAGNKIMPYLVGERDGTLTRRDNKPRLLFYRGLLPSTEWKIIESDAIEALSKEFQQYPYVGMWDDPRDPQKTLEFYWSEYYYNQPPQYDQLPTYNLFNKFHQFPIRKKIDIGYRRLAADFYLTALDIHNFQFTDTIRIGNTEWRVLEIEQWVNENTLTRVILENDVEYQFDSPINGLASCPLNVTVNTTNNITTVNSPEGINEACCNALGGTMVNGVCRIGGGGGVKDDIDKPIRTPWIPPKPWTPDRTLDPVRTPFPTPYPTPITPGTPRPPAVDTDVRRPWEPEGTTRTLNPTRTIEGSSGKSPWRTIDPINWRDGGKTVPNPPLKPGIDVRTLPTTRPDVEIRTQPPITGREQSNPVLERSDCDKPRIIDSSKQEESAIGYNRY